MPICKKCGKSFPNHIKINNQIHNICNRKFCLECSPFKKHNTLDITKYPELQLFDAPNGQKFCKKCGETKPITEFYRKGKTLQHCCKKCSNEYIISTQKLKKQKAIEYKGGKCIICGYNKYFGALEFHHIESDKKEHNLSYMKTYSFEKMKKELDKCILVCANCHREIHAQIATFSISDDVKD